MSTVTIDPLLHHCRRESPGIRLKTKLLKLSSLDYSSKLIFNGCSSSSNLFSFKPKRLLSIRAASTSVASFQSTDIFFKETFPLKRTETVLTPLHVMRVHIQICTYLYLYLYTRVYCLHAHKYIVH